MAGTGGARRSTGVCAEGSLGREAHRRAVAAASLGCGVVGARRMPRQTHKHRADGAIVVVVLVQNLLDSLRHLLVVDLGLSRTGRDRREACPERCRCADAARGEPAARGAACSDAAPRPRGSARARRPRRYLQPPALRDCWAPAVSMRRAAAFSAARPVHRGAARRTSCAKPCILSVPLLLTEMRPFQMSN